MRKKIAVGITFAMLILALPGCGSAPNEEVKEEIEVTTEVASDSDAEETTEQDVEPVEMKAGTIYDNVYSNESFGFTFEMPKDGNWEFYDAAAIANSTGVEKDYIQGFWDGTISPYERAMSYCMIAWDKTKGSSVIVSYFCPEQYNLLANTSAEEYLTNSAKAYEGSEVTKDKIGNMDVVSLELGERGDSKQYMFAQDRDGIILMITITTLKDENIDTYKQMIK